MESKAPVQDALAREVILKLRGAGHRAYLVGGCVRDLLLGVPPKDYDIATDARPDRIMDLFPNSGRVGAHFGVVLVRSVFAQVEVATFRSDQEYSDGRRPDGFVVGLPKKSRRGQQRYFETQCKEF